MKRELGNVLVWVARAAPGHRIIPPHLKLAILSRGRIRMSGKEIAFFLDQARAHGATWPDRITVGLEKIAADYPVTVELFLNQRPEMGPAEIDRTFAAYLELRRQRELQPGCFLLVFSWLPATERKQLESHLNLDINELFRRPRVTITPRMSPFAYLLLAYVCFPPELARFIKPERKRVELPPPPSSKMPPFRGRLKPTTQFHMRKDATEKSDSLGVQAGTTALIDVLDKKQAEGHTWYHIRLREPLQAVTKPNDPLNAAFFLPAGTEGWMVSDGIDLRVSPWSFFRHDLAGIEKKLSDLSLDKRINRLRQMTHEKAVPFDLIIGTRQGPVYLDDIPFVAGTWQFAKDYQAVEVPDGRWVDLHHLFVGLDVLRFSEIPASILRTPVGTNYSASTWAGDAGSASADATLRYDKETYERWQPRASDQARIQHYFETRVPDHDLLGDVDPWGIRVVWDLHPKAETVGDLIAFYYEDTREGGDRTLTTLRKVAIEQFLAHYGFVYQYDRDFRSYPVLEKQQPFARFMKSVYLFAQIFIYRRDPMNLQRGIKPRFVNEATRLLLYWLEYGAIENGATVP